MIDEIYNYRQSSLLTVPMLEEWETLCIRFEETLTDEKLTMFHKLCDMQTASAADNMRAVYKAGFKDGVAMIVEVQDLSTITEI